MTFLSSGWSHLYLLIKYVIHPFLRLLVHPMHIWHLHIHVCGTYLSSCIYTQRFRQIQSWPVWRCPYLYFCNDGICRTHTDKIMRWFACRVQLNVSGTLVDLCSQKSDEWLISAVYNICKSGPDTEHCEGVKLNTAADSTTTAATTTVIDTTGTKTNNINAVSFAQYSYLHSAFCHLGKNIQVNISTTQNVLYCI